MQYFEMTTSKELESVETTFERFSGDMSEWLYVSKKTGTAEVDGKTVKLKVAAWVYDQYELTPAESEPGDYAVRLAIVPDAASLGNKAKADIQRTNGCADIDEYDAWGCGYDVPCDRAELLKGITGIDDPRLQEVIQFAGSVAVPLIFSFVGFSLDKKVNYTNDGWDIIRNWVD